MYDFKPCREQFGSKFILKSVDNYQIEIKNNLKPKLFN